MPGNEETKRPFYATRAYADAFGLATLDVPEWQTAVLIRHIPNSYWRDAIGCYPLAGINPTADLSSGLDRLRDAGLVSIALVPDPLRMPPVNVLREAFTVCLPFKKHYVIDRTAEGTEFSHMHRKWARKANRLCRIGAVKLEQTLSDWVRLYDEIVDRHQITDVQTFGYSYFAALAQMQQVQAFAAIREDRIVAMALWVCSGEIAYYHLAASAAEGYRVQAMYGIVAYAIEYYREHRFIHLGGGSGTLTARDGLASFKSGFANREVTAYFCGTCLDGERYDLLTRGRATPDSFFPAYRQA